MKEAVREMPCCAPLLHGRLARPQAVELAAAFRAIADPARLRLLSLLAAQEGGETCACFLTRPLGFAQPTVSHHHEVLHDAGLVGRDKRGAWVYYRIVPERLAARRSALTPVDAASRARTKTGRKRPAPSASVP